MPHVEKYAQLNDIITNTSNQPPTSKGRTLPPPGSPPFAPLPPKGSPEPGLYGTCLLAPHFVCEVSVYVFACNWGRLLRAGQSHCGNYTTASFIHSLTGLGAASGFLGACTHAFLSGIYRGVELVS